MSEIGYFDPDAGLEQSQRSLPHWFQPNVATFITFRTADSMPKEVVRRWTEESIAWLQARGISPILGGQLPEPDKLPSAIRTDYLKQRSHRWHWHLDSCQGKCELRNRELAEVVLQCLRHFDSQRYDLDCAIVMPNHVHLLVQFRPGTTCRQQCESWLHYSAWRINKRLGRRGAFWQSEPFDHLIRSAEQFQYLRQYIAENGVHAFLPESDYLYWKSAA